MLSIGEFSRVTQITVKALRLYHEKDILVPDKIDPSSGYRYYRSVAVDKAMIITRLKSMGFSLDEIRDIILNCDDDSQMADRVEKKILEIEQNLKRIATIKKSLSLFLDSLHPVELPEKLRIDREIIPAKAICSLRFQGRYAEISQKIGFLARRCGRLIAGGPFALYYDGEYKEDGADIEVCFTVKKEPHKSGVNYRILEEEEVITLIHHGPYDELSRSYSQLFDYCHIHNLNNKLPIREYYIRGPGFIFRGNPRKYVTKLAVPFKS